MTSARTASRTEGLIRERLLPDARALPRVCLVAAPAGYGKTILLKQIERRLDRPGVSATAREWGRDAPFAKAVAALPRRAYVAVDDAHELAGSRAEAELIELIEGGPEELTVLVATRVGPAANLSRLSVTGDLWKTGVRELRFRSWEVDRLYRDVYRDPLTPDEVTTLARRTHGWAACLQLFHRATSGQSARTRAVVLGELHGRSGVTAAYLARNVVDALPPALRAFLLETSALEGLTPRACDEVRGRSDSGSLLAELERRQLAERSLDGRTWRCDRVLRAHLDGVAFEEDAAAATALHGRAAAVLERHGLLREALRSYRLAGERGAVHRLLAQRPGLIDAAHDAPVRPVSDDPWLSLAAARRLRNDGRAYEALAEYRRAEDRFEGAPAAAVAAAERRALACWLEPVEQPSRDWAGALLAASSAQAVRGEPLVEGIGTLLEGDAAAAIRALENLARDPAASAATAVAATIGLAAARLLAGDDDAIVLADRAAEEAELLDLPWVVRVARSVLALARDESPPRFEDPIGELLASLFAGLGALRRGRPEPAAFDDAVAASAALRLRTIEAWARAARALALVRTDPATGRDEAAAADAFARAAGLRGPRAYALLAWGEATGDLDVTAAAESLAAACGIALPRAGSSERAVRVRCFGGLAIEVDGRAVSLEGIRPRARQVLRLLLLRAPHAVHREVLIDALWPHLSPNRAASSLHVAVSGLRNALERVPGLAIERDADAYLLRARASVEIDVVAFRRATAGGAGMADPRAALDLYEGDLFPEDGPAEWVVEAREQLRERAAHAALFLAEALLEEDPRAAAVVCERGLELDRHLDDLWRVLIDAHVAAGSSAAAARASRRYRDVLADLGVQVPVSAR